MAGASLVDRLRPGDHVCWSFADDAERRRVAVAYVRGGLRERHKILYRSEIEPATALAELDDGGIDTGAAMADGRLRVTGAAGAYLTGGRFDPAATGDRWRAEVALARREGHVGLRTLGDMAWAARPVPGAHRLPGYEAALNRLYADGFAMAVCLYDRRLFGEAALAAAARAHPATITARNAAVEQPLLRMIRGPQSLMLCGEADLSNRDAFAAVLSHVVADAGASEVVTLDLNALVFADAAACGVILAVGRTAGGRVRIAGARRSVRRVLTLQGADEIPGLIAA